MSSVAKGSVSSWSRRGFHPLQGHYPIKRTLRFTSATSAWSAVSPTLHEWLGRAWCRTLGALRLPMALDAIPLALASQRLACVAVGMRPRTQLA